jgi:hypothetical protein
VVSSDDIQPPLQPLHTPFIARLFRGSHTWVAGVEAGKFKPKLYKLHSLSLIYQRSLDEILAFFGLDVRQVGQEQELVDLPRTCPVPSPEIDTNQGAARTSRQSGIGTNQSGVAHV